MYSKGKPGSIPSDAQAREKLALYVYEYLLHMGCQQAAQSFLTEINWDKNITLGEPPGFLHSWWCVFWDLYCAAPERRETYEHSSEAKAFHDYGFVNTGGFPNGHHPAAPSPLNMPAGEGPGGMQCQPGAPGPSGMAFFPGPPGSQQGGPMPGGPVDIRPGMVHPGMRMTGVPPGPPRLPMNHNFGQGGPPPGHVVGPRGPPGPPPGPGTPIGPPHPVGPGQRPWLPPHSQYSSASPVAFNGPPPPGPGTPGIMPSPQESCVSDPYGPPPGMRVPPNHPAAAAAAAAANAAFGPSGQPGNMPHSNPSSVGPAPDGLAPTVTSSSGMMPHDMAPPPHMMNGGPPGPPQSAHSMPPNDPHMGMEQMKSSPAAHGSVGMPPRDDMSSGVPMSGPPMSGPPMPGMDPNGPPGMYIRPSMPHYGGEPMPGVPQSPHGGPHGPPPHSLPPGHPMMNGPPPPQLGVPQPGMPPHPAATGMPGDSSENAAILKIKESMQEEAKRFEKMDHVGPPNVPPSHLPPHSVSEAGPPGPPGPPVHGGPPPGDPYFMQQ